MHSSVVVEYNDTYIKFNKTKISIVGENQYVYISEPILVYDNLSNTYKNVELKSNNKHIPSTSTRGLNDNNTTFGVPIIHLFTSIERNLNLDENNKMGIKIDEFTLYTILLYLKWLLFKLVYILCGCCNVDMNNIRIVDSIRRRKDTFQSYMKITNKRQLVSGHDHQAAPYPRAYNTNQIYNSGFLSPRRQTRVIPNSMMNTAKGGMVGLQMETDNIYTNTISIMISKQNIFKDNNNFQCSGIGGYGNGDIYNINDNVQKSHLYQYKCNTMKKCTNWLPTDQEQKKYICVDIVAYIDKGGDIKTDYLLIEKQKPTTIQSILWWLFNMRFIVFIMFIFWWWGIMNIDNNIVTYIGKYMVYWKYVKILIWHIYIYKH